MQGIKKDMQQDMRIAKLEAGGGGGGSTVIVKNGDNTFTAVGTLDFNSEGTTVNQEESGEVSITIEGGSTPKQGFSPINIAACAQTETFEAAGNTILYLTIAEETMAIDRCTMWGIESSADSPGQVEVKFYRYGTGWGSASSVPFLGATSAASFSDGPNDISLTVIEGQTNTVTAGESIVVGVRKVAGVVNAMSDTGMSSKVYAMKASNGEVAMEFPATTPSQESDDWVDYNLRPAMTLWKA